MGARLVRAGRKGWHKAFSLQCWAQLSMQSSSKSCSNKSCDVRVMLGRGDIAGSIYLSKAGTCSSFELVMSADQMACKLTCGYSACGLWCAEARQGIKSCSHPSCLGGALMVGIAAPGGALRQIHACTPHVLQAHSRLASLLLEVRCSQAAVATLESLLQALPENSRTAEQRTARKSAQQRLQEARTAARRGQKLHHYKLLGLERGCTTEEVSLRCRPGLQGLL